MTVIMQAGHNNCTTVNNSVTLMISKNAASGLSVKRLLAGETNPGHRISKPPHKD